MKTKKQDHCKRANCQYYDHKHFKNNCSASAMAHRWNKCKLFIKKKIEDAS